MVNVIDKTKPRTVFLIYAVGAFVSVLLLGLILPAFETVFGMPYRVLYLLACLAGVLFLFSTVCFRFADRRWKPLLVIVALGNISYCLLTAAAIVWFRSDLTNIGLIYFIGEISVILSLAFLELVYFFQKRVGEV
jgi:hypothetical protein